MEHDSDFNKIYSAAMFDLRNPRNRMRVMLCSHSLMNYAMCSCASSVFRFNQSILIATESCVPFMDLKIMRDGLAYSSDSVSGYFGLLGRL